MPVFCYFSFSTRSLPRATKTDSHPDGGILTAAPSPDQPGHHWAAGTTASHTGEHAPLYEHPWVSVLC